MQEYINKAANLIEALPYIRRFFGKVVVIKYGGAAMIDMLFVHSVMRDVALLHFCGIQVVVVHGGGPEISEVCKRLNIPVQFLAGQRVTNAQTLEVVQMVLLGKINTRLIAELNRHGVKALGISGHDAQFLETKKLHFMDTNKKEKIDLGFVGQVVSVDIKLINTLLSACFLPVIAPIGDDKQGQSYNVNADMVASHVASALSAEKLVLLTDVNGLYADKNDPNTRVASLDLSTAKKWMDDGRISGGMIPKIRACVDALTAGVRQVHILDGSMQHSLLLEIFTDKGVGTMVSGET